MGEATLLVDVFIIVMILLRTRSEERIEKEETTQLVVESNEKITSSLIDVLLQQGTQNLTIQQRILDEQEELLQITTKLSDVENDMSKNNELSFGRINLRLDKIEMDLKRFSERSCEKDVSSKAS